VDIFAKVMAAFHACGNGCTVYIPPGVYPHVTTTLVFPVLSFGGASLWIDSGATIYYTGSGDAIALLGAGQSYVNAKIFGGGKIVGSSAGAHGIHLAGFNKAQFTDLRIYGFTNGDGWFNEGANTIDCFGCEFGLNAIGIHQVGSVISGTPYSPNAVHFWGGQVAFNTLWGAYEEGTQASLAGPGIGNVYEGVVFQLNGSNAIPGASGNMFLQRCDSCVVSSYFEYSASQTISNQVILGDNSPACGGPNSCTNIATVIRDSVFVSGGKVVNTINNVNGWFTKVDGNLEEGIVTNFFNNGSLSYAADFLANTAMAAKNMTTGAGSYNGFSGTSTVGACVLTIVRGRIMNGRGCQ